MSTHHIMKQDKVLQYISLGPVWKRTFQNVLRELSTGKVSNWKFQIFFSFSIISRRFSPAFLWMFIISEILKLWFFEKNWNFQKKIATVWKNGNEHPDTHKAVTNLSLSHPFLNHSTIKDHSFSNKMLVIYIFLYVTLSTIYFAMQMLYQKRTSPLILYLLESDLDWNPLYWNHSMLMFW